MSSVVPNSESTAAWCILVQHRIKNYFSFIFFFLQNRRFFGRNVGELDSNGVPGPLVKQLNISGVKCKNTQFFGVGRKSGLINFDLRGRNFLILEWWLVGRPSFSLKYFAAGK